MKLTNNWHVYVDAAERTPATAAGNATVRGNSDRRQQTPGRHPLDRNTRLPFMIPLPMPMSAVVTSTAARVRHGSEAGHMPPARHPLEGAAPNVYGPYSFGIPFTSRTVSLTVSGGKLVRSTPASDPGRLPDSAFEDGQPAASGTKAWGERDFQPGDLVYGIEKDALERGRGWYIEYGPFKQKDGKAPVACRIDDYRVLANEKGKRQHAPDEEQFTAALEKHDKYRSAINANESNESVRRKVKGGLHWATKVAEKHVHFVLDGMDIKSVVLKNYRGKNGDHPADPATVKNRAYTGAELRWIYRNRHDPEVQQHVHFWFGGEKVCPPWERGHRFDPQSFDVVEDPEGGPDLWAQYTPTKEA